MDTQEERIALILADGDVDNEEKQEKSTGTIAKYLHYLKENIELPCIVTGIEDFPWEEKYVFGYGNKKEYEKLKKENPSYKDKFEILDFIEDEDYNDEQIFVSVKRLSDQKEFILELDYLKAVDKKSKNYQLLDDYSVWYVNY
ncbi:MAG: hypothetical protein JRE92_01565 [Deltaproteobacteria bacterium]|jgi:hypothetical protein|nr:hypothetical protein [Deltaproteobacteria bacterium]